MAHRFCLLWLVLTCLAASLPSPVRAQPPPVPPCPSGAAAGPADTHLYFVTTRLAACAAGQIKFGETRGAVTFGRMERGRPPRLIPVTQPEADWLAGLRADLANHRGRVLIYVHGYLNSFDDAVSRAQTLRQQSSVAGPILIFSWPSENCAACYTRDEENALWTQIYFDRLLTLLLQEPAVDEIVLLGHSMGNRILLRSIAESDRSLTALSRQRIRNIVLAAPDVDRTIVERDYVAVLDRPGRTTTIYASRADSALRVSWKVHGYPRAGDTACRILDLGTGASLPRCLLGLRAGGSVTLVDTSRVSAGAGHRDFVESRAAAADLCRVLEGRTVFPGRDPMVGHPGAVLLTNGALSPADCPR